MGQHVWLVLAVATLLAIIVNPALSQTSANTSQLGQQLSGTAFPMGQQTRGNASHASHVLLISVDGLHEQDLAQWVSMNASSTLASLARQGVTYTSAYIDGITDSFPGIMALTTGGNSAAHGVYYDDSYDRSLYPPGTTCTNGKPNGPSGTKVVYDETIDLNSTELNAGAAANGSKAINASTLPLNGNCQPIHPHSFVRVNTIFEVARSAGLHTAWADKHPAYDLLNRPSGNGVEDLYTPEINAAYKDGDYTTHPNYTMVYDTLHVDAAVNWIQGKDHTGAQAFTGMAPNLFGFNFQTVSVTQKVPNMGGYDNQGTFLPSMVEAMLFVDEQVGRLVSELKNQGLYNDTAIIITAKHGQSPILPSKLKLIPSKAIQETLNNTGIKPAQITADDVAIIWLQNKSDASAAVAALRKNASALGISSLIYGSDLVKQGLAASEGDSRAPDIVVKVQEGVIYTNKPKGAEHGGLNPDDQHVALLVSGGGLSSSVRGTTVNTKVYTKQVAPTILKLLGLNPTDLTAVQQQGTAVLPGLGL